MQHAPFGAGATAPANLDVIDSRARAATGFAGGTRIMTLDGMIPIDCLAPGDRIITRDSGMVRLCGVASQVYAALCPVILSPSTQGHIRPEAELVLGGAHSLLLRDWRAQALYGRSSAMVPAQRLIDGAFIRTGAEQRRLRLFTLRFDAPHVVYAEGVCAAAG